MKKLVLTFLLTLLAFPALADEVEITASDLTGLTGNSHGHATITNAASGLKLEGHVQNSGGIGFKEKIGRLMVTGNSDGVTINKIVIKASTTSGKKPKFTVYKNSSLYTFSDPSKNTDYVAPDGVSVGEQEFAKDTEVEFTVNNIDSKAFAIAHSATSGNIKVTSLKITYSKKKTEALMEWDTTGWTDPVKDGHEGTPIELKVGGTFNLAANVEPAEAAADLQLVAFGEGISVAKNADGTWTVTGASETESAYVEAQFPDNSNYYLDPSLIDSYRLYFKVKVVGPGLVTFEPAAGAVEYGTEVTLTSNRATVIAYSINGGEEVNVDGSSATIEIEGPTTIVAYSMDDNAEMSAEQTAVYTIKPTLEPGETKTVSYTFDFVNNEYGMTRQSGNSTTYNDATVTIANYENNGITLTLAGPENKNRLWTDGWRLNGQSSSSTNFDLTLKMDDQNLKITKVTFDKDVTSGSFATTQNCTISSEDGNYTEKTWTGSANPLKFILTNGTGKTKALKTITVTAEGAEMRLKAPIVLVDGQPITFNGYEGSYSVEGEFTEYRDVVVQFKTDPEMKIYTAFIPDPDDSETAEPAAAPARAEAADSENQIVRTHTTNGDITLTLLNHPERKHMINTKGQFYFVAQHAGEDASTVYETALHHALVVNPTAVDKIEMDGADAPALYFNLQGMRVDQPQKGGVYVRVQNGKAVKIAK